MSDNENPGALGASGASVGEMLGGNRTENTKPTDVEQASLAEIETDGDFAGSADEDGFSRLYNNVVAKSAARGEKFSFDPAPRSAKSTPSQWVRSAATYSQATNYHIKGMDELPDPLKSAGDYWVKGLLNPQELSVWYGQPGAGKSFLLLYLAYHIALGLPVLGRRVKKTAVLYVVLEAATGFERRLAAMKQVFGEAENFKWITQPVDLFSSQADVDGLIAAAANCGAGIVIIDTLARAFGPGNENESGAMGQVLSALYRIENDSGAHVALVHHSGKNEDRGPRGHSSLKAAADVVVEFKRDGVTRTVCVEKSRDGVDGETFAFDLKGVDLGKDADGDEITTCIAAPSSEPPQRRKHELSGKQKAAFDLLVRAVNDKGQMPPLGEHFPQDRQVVPEALWRHYCDEGMGGDRGKPDSLRKAFDRARTAPKNYGRAGIWGGLVWVT